MLLIAAWQLALRLKSPRTLARQQRRRAGSRLHSRTARDEVAAAARARTRESPPTKSDDRGYERRSCSARRCSARQRAWSHPGGTPAVGRGRLAATSASPDAIAFANGAATVCPSGAIREASGVWRIAPSAAIPVAIPTCRNVLLIPDAIPAPLRLTTLTAVEASGALTKPIPIPPTTKPGDERRRSRAGRESVYEQQGDAAYREPAAEEEPHRDTHVDSRPAIGATTNESRDSGRKMTPVLTARVAEHALRYSGRKRNCANIPAEITNAVICAPVKVGTRKSGCRASATACRQLDERERDEQDGRRRRTARSRAAPPAPVVAAQQAEDEREQPRRQRDEPGHVEPAVLLVARLVQFADRRRRRRRSRSGC